MTNESRCTHPDMPDEFDQMIHDTRRLNKKSSDSLALFMRQYFNGLIVEKGETN